MYITLIPGATYEPLGCAIPRFGVWNMKLALTAAEIQTDEFTPRGL